MVQWFQTMIAQVKEKSVAIWGNKKIERVAEQGSEG